VPPEDASYAVTVGDEPAVHEALAPLSFLLGRWRGTARALFTSEELLFTELSTFDHVGKPFLSYRQQAWHLDGPASHSESGFLRAPSLRSAVATIAQPTGIVEIAAGPIGGTRIELATTTIALAPDAKPVTAIERFIEVDGDELHYLLRIAVSDEPVADHIEGHLRREQSSHSADDRLDLHHP